MTPMTILENVPLAHYSTMRLGGTASYLADITNREELKTAVAWAHEQKLEIIMIGGGSNIIWKDEGFNGLVLVNKISGFEVYSEDEENAYITVGAGENWDSVVERALHTGKSGIEYLSYIPGTAGGAPVQNIGAYGHELSEIFVSLEAFDIQENKFVIIPGLDCGFGYRTSRFKFGADKNRYLITSITLHLTIQQPGTTYYHWLTEYLEAHAITKPSPLDIRQAVIEIRKKRLPDPEIIPNNGSFFANPIISAEKYHNLLENHPKLASWPSQCFWELPNATYKVAAGALLDYLGFKDFHDPTTGMGTWKEQALVLINENADKTANLLAFKKQITDKVQEVFEIQLEQEPEILPS